MILYKDQREVDPQTATPMASSPIKNKIRKIYQQGKIDVPVLTESAQVDKAQPDPLAVVEAST